MFELKISNLYDAVDLSKEWATHTVSLLDPGMEKDGYFKMPVAAANGKLQRYYFHDLTPDDNWRDWMTKPPEIVTHQQIQDILAFTTPLAATDKLLVHCHAGISRSTAAACGILCQHGLTPKESSELVLSVRKQAYPNKHVLQLFDEILRLENQLVEASAEVFSYCYY